jgi:hypothetical protein
MCQNDTRLRVLALPLLREKVDDRVRRTLLLWSVLLIILALPEYRMPGMRQWHGWAKYDVPSFDLMTRGISQVFQGNLCQYRDSACMQSGG